MNLATRSFLLIGLAAAACLGDGPPATLPDAAQNARITKLIEKLDSESFKTRNAAHEELRRFGRAAEAPIKAAIANADGEVRDRLTALLEELVISDIAKGTPVQFPQKTMTLPQALQTLAQAAGRPLRSMNNAPDAARVKDMEIDVADLNGLPWLDAIEKVCDRGGICWLYGMNDVSWMLGKNPRQNVVNGCFSVRPAHWQIMHDQRLRQPNNENVVFSGLAMYIQGNKDPRIQVIGSGSVRLLEGRDKDGKVVTKPGETFILDENLNGFVPITFSGDQAAITALKIEVEFNAVPASAPRDPAHRGYPIKLTFDATNLPKMPAEPEP